MEILDLITRILYIIAIVAVIVGPLAAMLLACRQITGTWDCLIINNVLFD